jgi:hypothetical protein
VGWRAQNAAGQAGTNVELREFLDKRALVARLLEERPDRLTWQQYAVATLAYVVGVEAAVAGRMLRFTVRDPGRKVRDVLEVVETTAYDYDRWLWLRAETRRKDWEPEHHALDKRFRRGPKVGRVEDAPPRPWSVATVLDVCRTDDGVVSSHRRTGLRWEVRRLTEGQRRQRRPRPPTVDT